MTHAKSPLSRRGFLGGALAAAAALPFLARSQSVRANVGSYNGYLVLSLHAGGGWDPLLFSDPKPNPEFNRLTSAIGSVGPFRFSDHPAEPSDFGYTGEYTDIYRQYVYSNRRFFERYQQRLCVFNGVETRTNNHDTGTRYVWSGKSEVGHPSLSALVAAQEANLPLAYFSNGGYDYSAGLVPLSRSASTSALKRIMFPYAMDPGNPESATYHAAHAESAIERAKTERLARQKEQARLPAWRRALDELISARSTAHELDMLELPTLLEIPGNTLSDVQAVVQSLQLSFAAMAAGLSLASSITYGGFDTHGNHDRDHSLRLAKLLGIVNFAVEEAARQNLTDRLIILVGSDFGRGPHYNGTGSGSGKDHWSNTSFFALLPPSLASRYGNRVIGATDESARALKLDPATLEPSTTGISLTPAVIHRNMRKLLGVSETTAAARFPLPTDRLELFT